MNVRYSKEQLAEAVKKSKCWREVCEVLGKKTGQDRIKKRCVYFRIGFAHFKGQRWPEGLKFGFKRSLRDYLSGKVKATSHFLRLRLIAEKVFEAKCSECEGVEWLGKPMPLELDHINGIKTDNRLKNLRLLCPNCHAFTPTYKVKNRASSRIRHMREA